MNEWIQILGEEQFSGLDSSTIYLKKKEFAPTILIKMITVLDLKC